MAYRFQISSVLLLTLLIGSTQPAQGAGGLEVAFNSAIEKYDAGDYAAALPIFETVARQKHVQAAYMAGLMHHRGRGTQPDAAKAIQYYAIAADANFPPALGNLGIVYRDGGPGVEPDAAKAEEYLRRAAHLNNAPSQTSLGAMQFNRKKDDADKIEGLAWMIVAAGNGDETATGNLKQLEPSLSPEAKAAADKQSQILRQQIQQVLALHNGGGATDQGASDSGLTVEKAQGLKGESIWAVAKVKDNSAAAKNGFEVGDQLVAAWDGQGNMIDIHPEAGEAAIKKVLAMKSYKMKLFRPSLAAANEDPIINLQVMTMD